MPTERCKNIVHLFTLLLFERQFFKRKLNKVDFLRFELIPKFYFFHFSYFIGDHKGDFFNIQSQITLILDKKSGNNLNFVEEIFACPFKPNRICSRS